MVEGLLLDGIHAKAAGSPVGVEADLPAGTAAHKAQAALPLTELAIAGTNVTLDPVIGQPVPVAGWKRLGQRGHGNLQGIPVG
jgi:hypothetical protein